MKKSIPTSFTLSQTAKDLLRRIAEKNGIPMTSVIELLIRDKAKQEGIRGDSHDNDNTLDTRNAGIG